MLAKEEQLNPKTLNLDPQYLPPTLRGPWLIVGTASLALLGVGLEGLLFLMKALA